MLSRSLRLIEVPSHDTVESQE